MSKSLVCQECYEPVSQGNELCDLCKDTLALMETEWVVNMMQEGNIDALTLYRRYRDGYEG